MIRVEGLHCGIGAVSILHGIDLEVERGTLNAIVGANGAGKTSLLRAISGQLPIGRGDILFDGKSVRSTKAYELARSGLVHIPQGRQIIPNLTVEDNLRLGAGSVPSLRAGDVEENLEREYTRFPILKERRNTAGGAISGGEQQMLAISRGLMMKPKVLMLDEPSLGLAPRIVRAILSVLRSLTETGVTVILVEQVAFAALAISDRGHVLQNGRIVLSGDAADLMKDQALVQGYLG